MHTELVSIITPSYNSSAFIRHTIESVQNQTHSNWELLIVDDFSTDDSVEIIKHYSESDNRIILICLGNNVGAAEARNIAIRNAKGKFIAFLDSDDLWRPEKLERQLSFMKIENYAFSFTSYQRIDQEGIRILNEIKAPKEISYKDLLKNTIIGTLTVMVDREKTGYFEMPVIKSSHDFALWLQILKRGFKAYGLQQSLSYYRIVKTSNTNDKLKASKDVWRVYRDIERLNILDSLYNFMGYVINASLKRIKHKTNADTETHI
jgi:teichuronic acid biosynthesis glycosyltransferase TuaG